MRGVKGLMKVVKKDNTKEDFNVQKVVVAVNKSAFRALVKFTDDELKFICKFVEDEARKMGKEEIQISEMHARESKPEGGEKLPRLPQL